MRQIPQTQKTPSKQASKQAIYYFIDVYRRQVLFLATSPAPLQLATYTTTTTTTTTCFATSSTTSSSHVTATPFQHALPQAYMTPHFTHFPHCKPVAKQARKQASQPASKQAIDCQASLQKRRLTAYCVCQPPFPGALNFHYAVSTQGDEDPLVCLI